ncbi:hypothetical protein M3Y97_00793400 [Aphelenchoides bicaudatus]|nr:hypothetical protein M3Y97_00793400 [Aphelenchoides bicaudatus]
MVVSETDKTPTYTYSADKVVTVLQPLKKDPNQSISRLFRAAAGQVEQPKHVAFGDYKDVFILNQPESFDVPSYHAVCGYSVWMKHADNGDRYQEKRTLNFVFFDDIPDAVRHSVAEDYFLRLNAASRLSKDAVEFLMNSLILLRDLPNNYIRLIDIKIERVAQSEELVIPTSKECESDEEVEDLVAGHVQTALEHAYPNALTFETIAEQLRATPEQVTAFLAELQNKGIAEQLESGEYIRVNAFAKAAESKLNKAAAERPPTIAIICSLFLENLAVSRIVENAHTVHMYNLNGDSNVYTIGDIGPHRVVVTKLSILGDSRQATTSSGSITTRLLGNFQQIEHVIICGVGGGVPHFTDPNQHVRLGDVVLSSTQNGSKPAYVYGSSLVKDRTTGRVIGLTPQKWSPKEEPFIDLLHSRGDELQAAWLSYADQLIRKLNEEKTENLDFTRPSAEVDVIAVVDAEEGDTVVAAHPDERSHSKVHEGTVASMIRYTAPVSLDDTDTPIKQPNSQALRNGFLKEYNAKAFDAGFPSVIDSVKGNCIDSYLLIRGIADYQNGSSRFSKTWQSYSSAQAAALTRVLIEMLPSKK